MRAIWSRTVNGTVASGQSKNGSQRSTRGMRVMTALDELRAADAARLKQEQKQNTAINARARAAKTRGGPVSHMR